MTERLCGLPQCGKPMERHEGERLSKFLARVYCCRSCASAGAAQNKAALKPVRMCRICKIRPQAKSERGSPYLHCGRPRCRDAVNRGEHLPGKIGGAWPEIEAATPLDFSKHELKLRVGCLFIKMNRPDVHSPTSSSALWAVRE